jgi:hypothetical protein
MKGPTMSIRRTPAVIVSTLLAVGLTAGPASADSTSPTPATTVSVDGDRVTITTDLATVQSLCTRADHAMKRLDTATTRLAGDADVPGSIAWARTMRNEAEAAGRQVQADRWQLVIDRRERRLPEMRRANDTLHGSFAAVCVPLQTTDPS